jgi:Domain of unknown function (DUF4352)
MPSGRPGILWWIGLLLAPYVILLLPYTWRSVKSNALRGLMLAWAAIILLGVPMSRSDQRNTTHTAYGSSASSTSKSGTSSDSDMVVGVVGRPVRLGEFQVTVTGISKTKHLTNVSDRASRSTTRRPHLPHFHCHGRCNIPNLPSVGGSGVVNDGMDAKGTFLVANMTIKNLSSTTLLNDLSSLKLVDSTGHVHDDEPIAGEYLVSNNTYSYLAAGQVKKVVAVFDIPAAAGPRRLELRDWQARKGITINWAHEY